MVREANHGETEAQAFLNAVRRQPGLAPAGLAPAAASAHAPGAPAPDASAEPTAAAAPPRESPKEWYSRLVKDQPYDNARTRQVREVLEAGAKAFAEAGSTLQDVECTADGCTIVMHSDSANAMRSAGMELAANSAIAGNKILAYDQDQLLVTMYVVTGDSALAQRAE